MENVEFGTVDLVEDEFNPENVSVLQKSGRRSEQVKGFVNFPIQSEKFHNTLEGGMAVYLVVVEGNGDEAVCCATNVYQFQSESLVGSAEDEAEHYPDIECSDEDMTTRGLSPEMRFMSQPYLSTTLLGSTGWSGYQDPIEPTETTEGSSGGYWQASEDDLSDDGKSLLTLMKKLYPNSQVMLITYLDT